MQKWRILDQEKGPDVPSGFQYCQDRGKRKQFHEIKYHSVFCHPFRLVFVCVCGAAYPLVCGVL